MTPDMDCAPAALRVASYNIHRAVGTDRRQDTQRIAKVIAELEADIVGLQEVEWTHDHTDEASQFEYLAHLPGYRAVAGPNIRDHRGHYGNLLLTRLPVHQVRQVDLSESRREPRGAIDVEIGGPEASLRVIVTHLGLGVWERWRQAARLQELVSERSGQPTLLLGDFNDWLPGSPTLRPLVKLCQANAPLASYPSAWPLLALDRILIHALPVEPDIRIHASRLARRASDHLPVTATLPPSALARKRAELSLTLEIPRPGRGRAELESGAQRHG